MNYLSIWLKTKSEKTLPAGYEAQATFCKHWQSGDKDPVISYLIFFM